MKNKDQKITFHMGPSNQNQIRGLHFAPTHDSTCSPRSRSKEPIQLNVWNTINLERSNRKGEIMVNKKDPVRGEAPVST